MHFRRTVFTWGRDASVVSCLRVSCSSQQPPAPAPSPAPPPPRNTREQTAEERSMWYYRNVMDDVRVNEALVSLDQ